MTYLVLTLVIALALVTGYAWHCNRLTDKAEAAFAEACADNARLSTMLASAEAGVSAAEEERDGLALICRLERERAETAEVALRGMLTNQMRGETLRPDEAVGEALLFERPSR